MVHYWGEYRLFKPSKLRVSIILVISATYKYGLFMKKMVQGKELNYWENGRVITTMLRKMQNFLDKSPITYKGLRCH